MSTGFLMWRWLGTKMWDTLKTDRRPFLSHIVVSHVVVVFNLVGVPGRLIGMVVVLHLKIFDSFWNLEYLETCKWKWGLKMEIKKLPPSHPASFLHLGSSSLRNRDFYRSSPCRCSMGTGSKSSGSHSLCGTCRSSRIWWRRPGSRSRCSRQWYRSPGRVLGRHQALRNISIYGYGPAIKLRGGLLNSQNFCKFTKYFCCVINSFWGAKTCFTYRGR